MSKVSIMGVNFDAVTKPQAVELAMDMLRERRKGYVVTPNAEIVYLARHDEQFKNLLNGAAISLPDGIGVIHAAKIQGKPIYEKVAGVEFAVELMEAMAKEGMSVYFMGAKPGVAQKAAENLAEKYKGLKIAGYRDGYFKSDEEAIETVKQAGHIDLMLVCLGAPKQELFINKHKDEIDATLFCGLGGSLDIYAGVAQRAPKFYVDHGLEWLYRLKKEPWRYKRMARLPVFLACAAKDKITGKA